MPRARAEGTIETVDDAGERREGRGRSRARAADADADADARGARATEREMDAMGD